MNSAFDYAAKAIYLLTPQYDEKALTKALILKSSIMLSQLRGNEAVEELKQYLKKPGSRNFKDCLNYHLAFALYSLSKYEEAAKILNKLLSKHSKGDFEYLESCANLLGHINLIRGDYIKAQQYYDELLKLSGNVVNIFEAQCNLVLINSQMARYNDAEEFLHQLKLFCEKYSNAAYKTPYLLALQALYFESSDYQKSIEVLNDIYETSVNSNNLRVSYLCLRLLSESYYYLKDFKAAEEYLRKAESLCDVSNKLELTEIEVARKLLNKANKKDFKNCKITFENAYSYFENNKETYSMAQAVYHLADVYFRMGNTETALQYIEEFIRLVKLNGYYSFLRRESGFNTGFWTFIKRKYHDTILSGLIHFLNEANTEI